MPAVVSYPGVYVQEVPSGVRTIVGVGTSIGMFIGRARKGELYRPVQCLSFQDFERAFTSQYADSDLGRSVRLFFQNGGTNCYVARIADEQSSTSTLRAAAVTLRTEGGADSLRLEARSPGTFGNDIRMMVNYNTIDPESSFNLEVFRWTRTSTGAEVKADAELFLGLSMNPGSPRYARDIIDQQSRLVRATDLSPAAAAVGLSQSGRPIAAQTNALFRTEVIALFGRTPARPSYHFQIAVDGGPPRQIDLGELNFATAPLNTSVGFPANLATAITNLINARVSPAVVVASFVQGPQGQAGANNQATRLLRITSVNGDVKLYPGTDPATDVAAVLKLGTSHGGIEVSKWANKRPAPNGLVFLPDVIGTTNLVDLAELPQTGGGVLADISIGGSAPIPLGPALATTPAVAVAPDAPIVGPRFFQDRNSVQPPAAPDPVSDGVREKLAIIAAAIQAQRSADPAFPWTAELWGTRLAIVAATGADNLMGNIVTGGTNIGGDFINNVRHYSLGNTGAGGFQTAGTLGNDGGPPTAADYERAYQEIDREVDLFNLMVLPKDAGHSDATTRMLWGPASIFCQRRRAFLIMDPPADWTDSQSAVSPATGVNTLRVGLVKDHAAVYYPRLKINEAGRDVMVGPSGAIAGLMGRIDATRGVWKAPAGTEADLRGVTGVERRFSDLENGVMNPKAVNTIRVFPNGIVNWGARTMDGDDQFGSEYKYVPIRRLALFIEESLYRGLTWVVFEPNDEPLWAQIRLNVGAFMNNLFRQGAFQGKVPADAYFVKCDASTTTQNDRNLGIVNIVIGFAPLKPAEFVILSLQQMAGQIEV
jgi:phage tail sheath protein FI